MAQHVEGCDTVAKVVTMSIGCGTKLPTQNRSMESFIQAVDATLYHAKQQGRNQTVVDIFDDDHVTERKAQ
jgi:PleD family two-component response regulator